MSALQYHALWITLVVAAAAFAADWWWGRENRRQAAQDALEALANYSDWLAGQRRGIGFDGGLAIHGMTLGPLRRTLQSALPELSASADQLQDLHARATDFLWRQHLLRTVDPEAWLETDHDQRFMALWREHQACVQAMVPRLRQAAGEPLVDADSVSAA